MSTVWHVRGRNIVAEQGAGTVTVAHVLPCAAGAREIRLLAAAPQLMGALIDVMSECLADEVARGNGGNKMSDTIASAIELLAFIDGRENEIDAPAPPAEGGAA